MADHRLASEAISAALTRILEQLPSTILAAYSPHRREYNPAPVLETVLKLGKQVALPVVVVKGAPLQFRLWQPGTRMAAGVFGIEFPADGAVVIPETIIIPVVGFDRAGYRLGYGGGYYDRTLSAMIPRPRTIGVGFELGRLESIDPQPHDIPMDWIVTEAGILDLRPIAA